MSSRLPVASGPDAAVALQRAGFLLLPHRGKGSHLVLARSPLIITIPDHKELRRGTLRSIIRQAGLTVEAFTALL